MAVPADIAKQAESIGMTYNRRVKEIQSDGNLSQQGREKLLAEEYLTAKNRMAALRDGWKEGQAVRQKKLARDVFGTTSISGSDAISARDAADRAAQLTSSTEAANLLRRALNNGDTVLARAIAQHAFDRTAEPLGGHHWASVLDTFAEGRPLMERDIQELIDGRTGPALGEGFMDAMRFSISKPSDFGNVSDSRIAQMASE